MTDRHWRYDVVEPRQDALAQAEAAAETIAKTADKLDALCKRVKAEAKAKAQAEVLAELKARVDRAGRHKAPRHARAEYPGAAQFRALLAEHRKGARHGA